MFFITQHLPCTHSIYQWPSTSLVEKRWTANVRCPMCLIRELSHDMNLGETGIETLTCWWVFVERFIKDSKATVHGIPILFPPKGWNPPPLPSIKKQKTCNYERNIMYLLYFFWNIKSWASWASTTFPRRMMENPTLNPCGLPQALTLCADVARLRRRQKVGQDLPKPRFGQFLDVQDVLKKDEKSQIINGCFRK